MRFRKSHIAEILLDGYVKTPPPLKEQALQNIALQMCYNLKLKNHIFFPKLNIADPYSAEDIRNQWEETINMQSREMCKTILLPHIMQEEIIRLIRAIALQLLIWSGHWKEIFDIPCEFTSHFWIPTDWEEGRINEIKIAQRLMEEHRFSVHQRYRVACTYCLEEFIRPLWDQIPLEQRDFYNSDDLYKLRKWKVIQMWSIYVKFPESFICGNRFFRIMCLRAMNEGLTEAAIYSWSKVNGENKRAWLKAFGHSLLQIRERFKQHYQILPFMDNFRIRLPPSGQGDITCFLLSQICELKIEGFEAKKKSYECLVKHCLEWPH